MRTAALSFLAALALFGCNKEYDNPFAETSRTVAPRAEADVMFTSNLYTTRAGTPREVYAVEDQGSGLSRLTACNEGQRRCDAVEASAAPDRQRVVLRRVTADSDNDGRLTAADGEGLVFIDLTRGVEGQLLPQTAFVSGVDWSPAAEEIVYSGRGEGGLDDLFRMDVNGQNNLNLTATANIRERRPRIAPTGGSAVFERLDPAGKTLIYIYASRAQFRVSLGGPGTEPLTGTPYVVGSDADPDYSPDGRFVVFRRLTATGNGGLGTWDILTLRTDGNATTQTVIADATDGRVFRGAPDWGPSGIVFTETDAGGSSRLVVVQPDRSGRRTLVTQSALIDISFPRWLR